MSDGEIVVWAQLPEGTEDDEIEHVLHVLRDAFNDEYNIVVSESIDVLTKDDLRDALERVLDEDAGNGS